MQSASASASAKCKHDCSRKISWLLTFSFPYLPNKGLNHYQNSGETTRQWRWHFSIVREESIYRFLFDHRSMFSLQFYEDEERWKNQVLYQGTFRCSLHFSRSSRDFYRTNITSVFSRTSFYSQPWRAHTGDLCRRSMTHDGIPYETGTSVHQI